MFATCCFQLIMRKYVQHRCIRMTLLYLFHDSNMYIVELLPIFLWTKPFLPASLQPFKNRHPLRLQRWVNMLILIHYLPGFGPNCVLGVCEGREYRLPPTLTPMSNSESPFNTTLYYIRFMDTFIHAHCVWHVLTTLSGVCFFPCLFCHISSFQLSDSPRVSSCTFWHPFCFWHSRSV